METQEGQDFDPARPRSHHSRSDGLPLPCWSEDEDTGTFAGQVVGYHGGFRVCLPVPSSPPKRTSPRANLTHHPWYWAAESLWFFSVLRFLRAWKFPAHTWTYMPNVGTGCRFQMTLKLPEQSV